MYSPVTTVHLNTGHGDTWKQLFLKTPELKYSNDGNSSAGLGLGFGEVDMGALSPFNWDYLKKPVCAPALSAHFGAAFVPPQQSLKLPLVGDSGVLEQKHHSEKWIAFKSSFPPILCPLAVPNGLMSIPDKTQPWATWFDLRADAVQTGGKKEQHGSKLGNPYYSISLVPNTVDIMCRRF